MGIIALAGGNEFRDNCVQMDRRLLSLLPTAAPRVVIIPAAAVHGSPRMAAEHGARYFNTLGAQATAPLIVSRDDANNAALVEDVDGADMVYLAGGDPGYLLDVLRGSLLLHKMQALFERGGILAGSSAGAMVLAARMRVWNKGDWVEGLGLAGPLAVLVHHDGPQAAPSDFLKKTPTFGQPILGIAEATACFSSDNLLWEVAGVGSVTRYQPANGVAERFTHGQPFRIS